MRQVLDATLSKLGDRAQSVVVNVDEQSERNIVRKFKVERAPMPFVLAVAPNGAITGGFPTTVSEEQVMGALAGPAMARCLKALESRKLVLLCVQNESTKHNRAAMRGVRGFKADSRFGQATEIVTLDPRDPDEASFLKKLSVDPAAKAAVTVFLAPPGSVVAKYEGATDKDTMVAALTKAMSSCGSGCGSGGCR